MQLTEEQLKMLREPFEEAGAFVGCSEEEIKKLLEVMIEPLVTLAQINLRSKQKNDYGKQE